MKQWVKISLGIIVVVVVAGGTAYALTPSATPPPAPASAQGTAGAAAPSSAHPAPVGSAPAPSGPAAPAPPATAVASFTSWRNGGGLARVNAVGRDFGAIRSADQSGPAVVQAACTTLQTDVTAGKAYAPMPDPQTQTAWSTTLEQAGRAATDCVTAARVRDTNLMNQAAAETTTANTTFNAVTERLSYFSAH